MDVVSIGRLAAGGPLPSDGIDLAETCFLITLPAID